MKVFRSDRTVTNPIQHFPDITFLYVLACLIIHVKVNIKIFRDRLLKLHKQMPFFKYPYLCKNIRMITDPFQSK